jgi:endonuclease YncB( thermonuclease family)
MLRICIIGAAALLAVEPYALIDRVVKIADGDTLTVLDGSNVQHRIRLAGIDAPEKGQPYGTKARENLAAKVFKQQVRVEVIDIDRYRREVGLPINTTTSAARSRRRRATLASL